jgi:hypothetical protein
MDKMMHRIITSVIMTAYSIRITLHRQIPVRVSIATEGLSPSVMTGVKRGLTAYRYSG